MSQRQCILMRKMFRQLENKKSGGVWISFNSYVLFNLLLTDGRRFGEKSRAETEELKFWGECWSSWEW